MSYGISAARRRKLLGLSIISKRTEGMLKRGGATCDRRREEGRCGGQGTGLYKPGQYGGYVPVADFNLTRVFGGGQAAPSIMDSRATPSLRVCGPFCSGRLSFNTIDVQTSNTSWKNSRFMVTRSTVNWRCGSRLSDDVSSLQGSQVVRVQTGRPHR